jgi:hypothetical protein
VLLQPPVVYSVIVLATYLAASFIVVSLLPLLSPDCELLEGRDCDSGGSVPLQHILDALDAWWWVDG